MSTTAILRLLYLVAVLGALALLAWFFGLALPEPLKLPADGGLVILANLIVYVLGWAVLILTAVKWTSLWRTLSPARWRLAVVAVAIVSAQVLYVSAVLFGLSRSTDL